MARLRPRTAPLDRRDRPGLARCVTAGSGALLLVGLTACSGGGGGGGGTAQSAPEAPDSAVISGDDASAASVEMTSALFDSTDAVIVASEEDAPELVDEAGEAGLPMLIGTGPDVVEELDRLSPDTIVTASGTDLGDAAGEREVVEVDPSADSYGDLPSGSAPEDSAEVSVLIDPLNPSPADPAARANAQAAGTSVQEMPNGDPRTNGDSVEAARAVQDQGDLSQGVLAVGSSFGSIDELSSRMETATTVAELPGGGQVAFPGRRMVAAYGSPGTSDLGILGEQDVDGAIERTKELAAEYDPHSDVPVVPAFEIITTVASSEPGPDGNYSNELPPEMIEEWVDAAEEAGVYVVLDLQPGTTDFLTQAQRYEDLLKRPHVGLALDSEWRLEGDQRHMEQVGSVDAAEVNETADWLAQLTRENDLPQKVFVLHQFSTDMLPDRENITADRPELAMLVHADGHGTRDLKMGTWNTLKQDLPEGMGMAWKNFYDEDTPTWTPEETYDIEPRPWFVSYQ
ncbi:hypothetical protein [Kocuria palustris]|uniref:hypothetical protein n=1 Tax=Kocuria palustris TaxID=71999 RepID=UPI0021B22168|nr:hypothetical protein [Kocuria palustris]